VSGQASNGDKDEEDFEMIFIEKAEERYNIGQNFFSKKQSKDFRRKAVAFFLCHSIPEKDSSYFSSLSSFPIWTAFEISAIFTAFYT
jgi:hypothetical protein